MVNSEASMVNHKCIVFLWQKGSVHPPPCTPHGSAPGPLMKLKSQTSDKSSFLIFIIKIYKGTKNTSFPVTVFCHRGGFEIFGKGRGEEMVN